MASSACDLEEGDRISNESIDLIRRPKLIIAVLFCASCLVGFAILGPIAQRADVYKYHSKFFSNAAWPATTGNGHSKQSNGERTPAILPQWARSPNGLHMSAATAVVDPTARADTEIMREKIADLKDAFGGGDDALLIDKTFQDLEMAIPRLHVDDEATKDQLVQELKDLRTLLAERDEEAQKIVSDLKNAIDSRKDDDGLTLALGLTKTQIDVLRAAGLGLGALLLFSIISQRVAARKKVILASTELAFARTETPQMQAVNDVSTQPMSQAPKIINAPQSMGLLPSSLTALLVLWGLIQNFLMPGEMQMTWGSAGVAVLVSYVYCDYWLWMLHCFLDRKENQTSRIPAVAELATKFQQHHEFPKRVFDFNQLAEIDDLIIGVAGMGLLAGYWTSPCFKLVTVGVILLGELGCLNHVYCHASTHNYQVPAVFKFCHRWRLLPSPHHHRMHHTAPHEENWNFLNGFHWIYERMYYATGSSYWPLFAMFYALNPIFIQPWLVGLGVLS